MQIIFLHYIQTPLITCCKMESCIFSRSTEESDFLSITFTVCLNTESCGIEISKSCLCWKLKLKAMPRTGSEYTNFADLNCRSQLTSAGKSICVVTKPCIPFTVSCSHTEIFVCILLTLIPATE